ncbi:hypothetical protein A2714_05045 [Candidatus Woesebacteria bacterium RIFCSPHIGHO2_01_FULL_38_9]|uniref:CYTH domain-containing protein n=2 Tax=Candidatus Woeseibacteriota TaxID=1752722 RepID=A0A1F7Y2Q6_9BACT|nr:MAG: hypothetical protein A2714_05045 [Candidatus Woesebacteria bacterium RIFCSPHIGHO2_01_FULL_38_9]OGM60902.1 MAG: hypothetical protein A3A75_02320 [Candidatus Woesebacteria bacterium RIFCSPLOWO2_01_FULL_39_10]
MSGKNNKSDGNIEIELRGLLTKTKYLQTSNLLRKVASKVWEDNKITYFFVLKGNILKVTKELSNRNARITLKVGDETENVLEEIHIPIPTDKVEKAVRVFQLLGYSNVNRVVQKRTNFKYKNANISLKYTKDWGYHFEIETLISNSNEALAKKKELRKICSNMGLKPMNKEEIRYKIDEINRKYGFI